MPEEGNSLSLINAPTGTRVGTVIGGGLQLVRALEHHGSLVGETFAATRVDNRQSQFAVKLLAARFAHRPEVVRSFESDWRGSSALGHANICKCCEVSTSEDGVLYAVSELLKGRDLRSQLTRSGNMETKSAVDIVHQACLGLHAAHQAGIVHCNLKPENLFLQQRREQLKILDFGTGKLWAALPSRGVGGDSVRHNCSYRAPEQFELFGKVDSRVDVWALGVILFEMLTGRLPFGAVGGSSTEHQIRFQQPESLSALRPDLPAGIISAVELALEKAPENRFESVLALAAAVMPYGSFASTRFSGISRAQRPPLLTPVSELVEASTTNAPVALTPGGRPTPRSIDMRERAYFIYTTLFLAAVIGFSGGRLLRVIHRDHPGQPVSAAQAFTAIAAASANPTLVAGSSSSPVAPTRSAAPAVAVSVTPLVLGSADRVPVQPPSAAAPPEAKGVAHPILPTPAASAAPNVSHPVAASKANTGSPSATAF